MYQLNAIQSYKTIAHLKQKQCDKWNKGKCFSMKQKIIRRQTSVKGDEKINAREKERYDKKKLTRLRPWHVRSAEPSICRLSVSFTNIFSNTLPRCHIDLNWFHQKTENSQNMQTMGQEENERWAPFSLKKKKNITSLIIIRDEWYLIFVGIFLIGFYNVYLCGNAFFVFSFSFLMIFFY